MITFTYRTVDGCREYTLLLGHNAGHGNMSADTRKLAEDTQFPMTVLPQYAR